MKLDRNINPDGRGRYALIHMRQLNVAQTHMVRNKEAIGRPNVEVPATAIRLGSEGPGDQFFVLKYKDKFAWKALEAYAVAVRVDAKELRDHANEYWDNPQCSDAEKERAEADSLEEFAQEIDGEVQKAKLAASKTPTPLRPNARAEQPDQKL